MKLNSQTSIFIVVVVSVLYEYISEKNIFFINKYKYIKSIFRALIEFLE